MREQRINGEIIGVRHTRGSGMATLLVSTSDHLYFLHADAGPLFRQLNAAFGGQPPVGRNISCVTTEHGTLAGFTVAG